MKYLLLLLFLLGLVSCNESNNTPDIHKVKKDSHKLTIVHDSLSKLQVAPKAKIDSTLIVIDTNTNLIWMKDDFSYIKGKFLKDWNEVFEWKNEINSSNYAGFNDWEVPSIKEYRSINKNKADRKKYTTLFNYIDSTSVWGHGPYAFWSKTTPNKHTASYMNFIRGFATSGNREKQYSSPYSSWKGVELGMSVRLIRSKKQDSIKSD
jgi:hypothetical protein